MSLKYIKSERGTNILVDGGYMYQRECNKPEKSIWRCVQYKQKCRGRVHVSNDEIIKYMDHNHVPDISKIEAKIQVNEMKEKARSTCESTHSVLGTIAQVEMSVAGQLPSVASLKRTIQRVRQTELSAPSNPVDFNFNIPEKFKFTTDGELFLQYDSGSSDSKRILIFATNRNFELMENSEHWFCDRTFSSAPSIFSQLYTIHGIHYSNVIPSVYALLPDKKEETYKRFFRAVKSINPNVNPNSVMMDYEKAAMNAVKCEFPNVIINGCFFHLSQCVWRHIQEIGLSKKYKEDSEFALHVRMLPALAFVPQEDVIESFETLIETNYFSTNEELLTPLIDYFESNWIGRLQRRHRREPKFNIQIWNCFSLVEADLPQTNNSVEGWHNCFSSMLNSSIHPSIWKFITSLQKEERVNRLKVEQLVAGNQPPSKKKYNDRAKKLKNICSDYNNRSIDDYLRGVAHNFQLQV